MNPVDYVNPLIGAVTYAEGTTDAHGFGKTFPGPTTPFGMVQLSPDTITGGDNGSGYSYVHDHLEGFSFTHLSGVGWYGDLGNFLVTPTTGPLQTSKAGYRSQIRHDTEIATAGYYAITLDDYAVRAELTAAPRAGMLRFTFPKHQQSRIQIDLARRIAGTSTEQLVRVIDAHTICGSMRCPPTGGGFGNGGGGVDYTLHFYCQFSKPLEKHGVWRANIPENWQRGNFDVPTEAYQQAVAAAEITYGEPEAQGRHLGFFAEFATEANEEVLVKCGVSFVSIEGAKANLEHDMPQWNFEQVHTQARALWADALSSVQVTGSSTDDSIKFYTALYRTMIDPRCVADITGDYVGADGKIHQANDFTYRSIFSGWDVFRSQFPLQTLINPRMVNDEIHSLLQIATLSGKGYLPRWELLNAYTGCMLGNPAVSVIVDAYRKGIREYDVDRAFSCCQASVDTFTNGARGYAAEECGKGSVSETLEYAYSDWCFAKFAEELGQDDLARVYHARSKAYHNLWDEEVQWFRGKSETGNWLPWKGKTEHGQGCRESNPYQQGWFVPHDVPGLVKLMGRDAFLSQLTELFDKTPDDFHWNDYYNHPNEPVHNVAFLFNEIDEPWLTQQWTRRICENAYGADPFGLCGNEDVGQMSAWFVLAAMGLHPVCPGDNRYQITSPVFDRVDVTLDPHFHEGETFTIIACGNSPENLYIQSLSLNGLSLDRFWISHQEIAAGGTLELQMGPRPVQCVTAASG